MKKTVNVCLRNVLMFVLGMPLLSGASWAQNPQINLVKNGVFDFDKTVSIGQTFESYPYFSLVQWMPVKDKKGKNIVALSCLFNEEVLKGLRESIFQFKKIDWSPNKTLNRELQRYSSMDTVGLMVEFEFDKKGTTFTLSRAYYWVKIKKDIMQGGELTVDDLKTIYYSEPLLVRLGNQIDNAYIYYYKLKFNK